MTFLRDAWGIWMVWQHIIKNSNPRVPALSQGLLHIQQLSPTAPKLINHYLGCFSLKSYIKHQFSHPATSSNFTASRGEFLQRLQLLIWERFQFRYSSSQDQTPPWWGGEISALTTGFSFDHSQTSFIHCTHGSKWLDTLGDDLPSTYLWIKPLYTSKGCQVLWKRWRWEIISS